MSAKSTTDNAIPSESEFAKAMHQVSDCDGVGGVLRQPLVPEQELYSIRDELFKIKTELAILGKSELILRLDKCLEFMYGRPQREK